MPRSPRRSILTGTSPWRTPARRWRLLAGSPAGRSGCDRCRASGGPIWAAGAADGHCPAGIPRRDLHPRPRRPCLRRRPVRGRWLRPHDGPAGTVQRPRHPVAAARTSRTCRSSSPTPARRSAAAGLWLPAGLRAAVTERTARNGLCSRHRDRWNRAGKPDLAAWDAPDLARSGTLRPGADCRFAPCGRRTRTSCSARTTTTGGGERAAPIPAGSSPTASSPARPISICAVCIRT